MTTEPDVYAFDSWERDLGTARGARLGPGLGSRELGCALYELDPGGQATPYHLHHGNEELLVVLDGELELRTPEGARTVHRGAVVAFPAGPEGAHRVRNTSAAAARYLLISTMRFPDVAEQLDTGTMLAILASGHGWAWPQGVDADYVDLTRAAIEADQG